MLPVHQRMAELCTIQKSRELTVQEVNEMAICLNANANYVWKMVKLENLSLAASMIEDVEWQHEICAQIEQLQTSGR